MRFIVVRTAAIAPDGTVTFGAGVLDTESNKLVVSALTQVQAQACAVALNAVRSELRF